MNPTLTRFLVQLSSANPLAGSDSIYLDRKGKPGFEFLPKCVYFYYVRFEDNNTITTWKHFWVNRDDHSDPAPIDEIDLPNIIEQLALHVRNNPAPSQDVHVGLGDEWKNKSYVVIFVDEENWKLRNRKQDPVGMIFVEDVNNHIVGNHSFYDAHDLDIELPFRDGRSGNMKCTALVMINHLKKLGGADLGDMERETYAFQLLFDVASSTPGNPPMTLIIDPTGTNQGPPQDPPLDP